MYVYNRGVTIFGWDLKNKIGRRESENLWDNSLGILELGKLVWVRGPQQLFSTKAANARFEGRRIPVSIFVYLMCGDRGAECAVFELTLLISTSFSVFVSHLLDQSKK